MCQGWGWCEVKLWGFGVFQRKRGCESSPMSRHVAVAGPCGSISCSFTGQNPEGEVKSLT